MKVKVFIKGILLTVSFLLLLSTKILADNILTVPEIFQEHIQWCWTGASQATLEYYRNMEEQCNIADWAWDRSDCCGNHDLDWDHVCNEPNYMYGTEGSLQAILLNWGVESDARSYALSQSTVTSEINDGRPFVMRFGWKNGGGHFLVGRGIMGDNVYYMDPWPEKGYTIADYDWMVSSTNHTCTHTLQIVTSPSPNICCDLDGDGDMDGSDLQIFKAAYAVGDLTADLDNNGVVDENDLAIFANKFGRTDCPIP